MTRLSFLLHWTNVSKLVKDFLRLKFSFKKHPDHYIIQINYKIKVRKLISLEDKVGNTANTRNKSSICSIFFP